MKLWSKYSNCILFAFLLYFRRVRRVKRNGYGCAGYVAWRWSRIGGSPHCLYAYYKPRGTLCLVAYSPHDKRVLRFPPPFFTGYTKWGDR